MKIKLPETIENGSIFQPHGFGIEVFEHTDESVVGGKLYRGALTLFLTEDEKSREMITLLTDHWGLVPEEIVELVYHNAMVLFGEDMFHYNDAPVVDDEGEIVDTIPIDSVIGNGDDESD